MKMLLTTWVPHCAFLFVSFIVINGLDITLRRNHFIYKKHQDHDTAVSHQTRYINDDYEQNVRESSIDDSDSDEDSYDGVSTKDHVQSPEYVQKYKHSKHNEEDNYSDSSFKTDGNDVTEDDDQLDFEEFIRSKSDEGESSKHSIKLNHLNHPSKHSNENYDTSEFQKSTTKTHRRRPQHHQHKHHSQTKPKSPIMLDDGPEDDNGNPDSKARDELLALAHSQRVAGVGTCELPIAQVVHVSDHYPGRYFLPHCTLLHRCGKHSGCCGTDQLKCTVKDKERVILPFYSVRIFDDGRSPVKKIEKLSFVNHTRCGCEPV